MAGENTNPNNANTNSRSAQVLKSGGVEAILNPTPAAPKPGEPGYVAPAAAAPDAKPKKGEEGYVEPKPGDDDYVAPVPEAPKPGEPGYVDPNATPKPKKGEPGYVEPKPGEEGYVDPAASSAEEIADDKLLEILRKRSGKDLKSLDEILNPPKELTEDEKRAKIEEEESEALQFGLKNKIFKKGELEAYNADKVKKPRDIAYEMFAAEELKNDDTLTPDDIQARFKSYMMEDLPEDSWMRQRREKEMDAAAKAYMATKYGAIENVGAQYKQYSEVLQRASAYKSNVESVISDLSTEYTTSFKDEDGDQKFTFKIPADLVLKAKEYFLHQDTFSQLNNGNVSKEDLAVAVNDLIIKQALKPIIEEVAKSYLATKAAALKMGKKGIKPEGTLGSGGAAQQDDAPVSPGPRSASVLAPTTAR